MTGIAGGEFGIRGFLDAYDAKTGTREWRTYTIPGPDHPDNRSWAMTVMIVPILWPLH